MLSSPTARRGRRVAASILTLALATTPALFASTASAAIVPTVPLGTAADYAVLGGSAVTNTGDSVLDGSLGISPGPASITGFPPGLVLPPGTTDENNAESAAAQASLTAGYLNAAGRPVDATTPSDLAGLTLQGGVYAGPSKSPLGLSGPLVLDGAGDPTTVFIFQTDSTLITGSGSTVTLVNGAQECNVFWQVGSSATLGSGSTFAGNILALTSITVTTGVTVHGRALARNGAVTLDDDVFTSPTCDLTTSTTTGPGVTTPDDGGGSGAGGDGSATTGGEGTGSTGSPGTPPGLDLTSTGPGSPGVPGVSGPPKTGAGPAMSNPTPWIVIPVALLALAGAASALVATRRYRQGPGPFGT
jgi:hypothetical protein